MIVNNVVEQITTHSFHLLQGGLKKVALEMGDLEPKAALAKLIRDRYLTSGSHMSEDEVTITVYHIEDQDNSYLYKCEVELAGNPCIINQMVDLDLMELIIGRLDISV